VNPLPLTPRQKQIIELSLQGLTAKQIAAQFGCTAKTVSVHRYDIVDRLGLEHDYTTFLKVCLIAKERGLLDEATPFHSAGEQA
jgi:DNA-binding NarL/FixJ family response regulator